MNEKIIEEKNKEIERLNNIINFIWKVFEDGYFEDGCDCIRIYDYLKELKEEKRISIKNNNLQDRLDTLKIEISSLMSRYFYEKDFCIEDTHLDKLLRIIDGYDKE